MYVMQMHDSVKDDRGTRRISINIISMKEMGIWMRENRDEEESENLEEGFIGGHFIFLNMIFCNATLVLNNTCTCIT